MRSLGTKLFWNSKVVLILNLVLVVWVSGGRLVTICARLRHLHEEWPYGNSSVKPPPGGLFILRTFEDRKSSISPLLACFCVSDGKTDLVLVLLFFIFFFLLSQITGMFEFPSIHYTISPQNICMLSWRQVMRAQIANRRMHLCTTKFKWSRFYFSLQILTKFTINEVCQSVRRINILILGLRGSMILHTWPHD